MSMIYVLLFSSLVFALTTQAQDCPKPEGDHMILKGDNNSFPDGTKVSFQCDPGYVSAGGSAVITCNAGTWSPIRPKCERRNCGPPGEVVNGNIEYPTGTEFGDKIIITCNTGFRLVGKSEIICGVTGWKDRLPECEIMTCDPPAKVGNGFLNPDKDVYQYRDVVQYTCLKGFTLNGSKSISCTEEEIFKPDPPKCVLVKCEEPNIAHAEWVSGSRPPYGHLATVTHRCTSGFRMEGEPTSTCDINSKWKPRLPQCVAATPTTTKPSVTKKVPTVSVGPTVSPGSGAPNVWQSCLIALLVIIVCCGLIACGCRFFGVPASIKKRFRKGHTSVAPTFVAVGSSG